MKDLEGLDLDIFFFAGDYPIHLATNGGPIPFDLADSTLCAIKETVSELPRDNDASLNENSPIFGVLESRYQYINKLEGIVGRAFTDFFGKDYRKMYSASFFKMAQRGFYSFDWQDIRGGGRGTEGQYYLIASPKGGTFSMKNDNAFCRYMREHPQFVIEGREFVEQIEQNYRIRYE